MNIDSIAPTKTLKDHIYSISRAEMKYHPYDPSTEIALCTDIDTTDDDKETDDTHTEDTEHTNGSQSNTEGPLREYAKEPVQPQEQSSQDTQDTSNDSTCSTDEALADLFSDLPITDEEFEAMYAPNTAKSPSPTSLAINGVSVSSHGVSELYKSQQSSDCQGNSDSSSSASAVKDIPFASVSYMPPTPTTNIIYIETEPPPSEMIHIDVAPPSQKSTKPSALTMIPSRKTNVVYIDTEPPPSEFIYIDVEKPICQLKAKQDENNRSDSEGSHSDNNNTLVTQVEDNQNFDNGEFNKGDEAQDNGSKFSPIGDGEFPVLENELISQMATCNIDLVTLPCLQNDIDDMSISLLPGIHPNDDDYEIIDKDGVSTMIAARDISKGEEVAYIYGRILLWEDMEKMTKKFPKRDWNYILMHGVCANSIIAVDVTDVEDSPCKSIQHNCTPNCEVRTTVNYKKMLVPTLVALQDIGIGQEITRDMSFHPDPRAFHIQRTTNEKGILQKCSCRSKQCRGHKESHSEFDVSTLLGQHLITHGKCCTMDDQHVEGGRFEHLRNDKELHPVIFSRKSTKYCQNCYYEKKKTLTALKVPYKPNDLMRRTGIHLCLHCKVFLCMDCLYGKWHRNLDVSAITATDKGGKQYRIDTVQGRDAFLHAELDVKLHSAFEDYDTEAVQVDRDAFNQEELDAKLPLALIGKRYDTTTHAKVIPVYDNKVKLECLLCATIFRVSRCVQCFVDLCDSCWYKWHPAVEARFKVAALTGEPKSKRNRNWNNSLMVKINKPVKKAQGVKFKFGSKQGIVKSKAV